MHSCNVFLYGFETFLSYLLIGAKQKETETEWQPWVEEPLQENLNKDAGSRFASWTLTAIEQSPMAENVYQGLVMGVFSSDVETKHKKERFCVWRCELALKDSFQTVVWKISDAVCH